MEYPSNMDKMGQSSGFSVEVIKSKRTCSHLDDIEPDVIDSVEPLSEQGEKIPCLQNKGHVEPDQRIGSQSQNTISHLVVIESAILIRR